MKRLPNIHQTQFYLFLASGFGFYYIQQSLKRILLCRKIQDTGSTSIASSPQGFVELQGYAHSHTATPSPLNGYPCVYYSLLIQEQRGSEKNKRWVTLAQETLDLPFLLYDESGFVTIYPKHAQIECDEKTNSLWSYPKEIQEKICTRYRISSNHFLDLLRPEIRVRFGCIYQDSTLYALGSLRVRLHEAALKFKTLNCFGSLKNEAQSKLFLANCHQDELLSRLEKHNILKILLGALIVAVCFTFLITFKK